MNRCAIVHSSLTARNAADARAGAHYSGRGCPAQRPSLGPVGPVERVEREKKRWCRADLRRRRRAPAPGAGGGYIPEARGRAAIEAIRAGREQVPVPSVSRPGGAERELETAPAPAARPVEPHDRFAAGQQHRTGQQCSHRARGPLSRRARRTGQAAAPAPHAPAQTPRFPLGPIEPVAVRTHDAHEVAAAAPDRRARADRGSPVARHVRQHERHEARARRAAEAAALDRREPGAQAVEREDRGARLRERGHGAPLGRQRQPLSRQADERRRAAGNEAEDHVALAEGSEEAQGRARRAHARGVRLGMRGEDDVAFRNPRGGVPARQNHQPSARNAIRSARHPGCRLARGKDTDRACSRKRPRDRGLGQRPRHGRLRFRAREGRVVETPEQASGGLHRGEPQQRAGRAWRPPPLWSTGSSRAFSGGRADP